MDADLSQRLTRLLDQLDHWLPPAPEPVNWKTEIAALWQRHALGGRLVAVPPRDALTLDDLMGIERQKGACGKYPSIFARAACQSRLTLGRAGQR
jgi:predicted AAA+ superfamily ATPase